MMKFFHIKMFKFNFSPTDGTNEDWKQEEDASVERQSLNTESKLRPSVEIHAEEYNVSYRF